MNKKNRKGFTIVELVIVIAVIGILATVLVPTFGDVIGKANDSKLLQALKNEYTTYSIEYASEADFNDDMPIKYENKYYQVENGAIKLADGKPVELTGQSVPTTYFDASTDKVVKPASQEGAQS